MQIVASASEAQELLFFCSSLLSVPTHPFFVAEQTLCMLFYETKELLSFCVSAFCSHSLYFVAEQTLCTLYYESVRRMKWICILGTEGCHLSLLLSTLQSA